MGTEAIPHPNDANVMNRTRINNSRMRKLILAVFVVFVLLGVHSISNTNITLPDGVKKLALELDYQQRHKQIAALSSELKQLKQHFQAQYTNTHQPLHWKQSIDKWKESIVKCSDANVPGEYHDRTCVLQNFCMNSKHGIFPQFQTIRTSPSTSSIEQLSAQLSTYVPKGKFPVYFRPKLKYQGKYFNNKHPSTVKQRQNIFLYTPAAWPEKVPVHYFVNNMLPAFRQINNFLPDRLVRYPSHSQVWNYNVDLLLCSGGYASLDEGFINDKLYGWLGVDNVVRMSHKDFKPVVEGTICYDKIYAGTGGTRSHSWGKYNSLNNQVLLADFRDAYLNYHGCLPRKNSLQLQSSFESPIVTLIQRESSTNDQYHGRRVFDNIQDLDAVLRSLDRKGIIQYSGYHIFNKTVSLATQACILSDTSILIGIHGNALGLELFMEPKTVLFEVQPKNDYFKNLSGIKNIHRITMRSNEGPKPPVKEFQAKVMEAVKYWKRTFS